jgi:polysaccharide pyruvyl transferase WcaK-like protein
MKRILITGLHRTVDNGEFSLLIGLVEGLKRSGVKLSSFHFWMLCDYCWIDEERIKKALSKYAIKITPVKVICPIRVHFLLPILRIMLWIPLILKSHIVIHLGADGFSDEAAGGALSTIYHGLQLLIANLLRKPVIILSASIGPFKTSFTRSYALFVLKRISGLTVRKGSAELYLKKFGLNVIPVADLAFLLPDSNQHLNENLPSYRKPLASLVVNWHIWKKFPRYIDAMASIADHLCSKGFYVLIIPQIIHGKYNEVPVAEAIRRQTTYKNNVEVVKGLLPLNMKELFRQSKIVISSKYHSSILSFSMLTPTITLNYAPKVKDLHEMLSLENFLVELTPNYNSFTNNLLEKIEIALKQADVIQNQIRKNYMLCLKLSLKNIELITNHINYFQN